MKTVILLVIATAVVGLISATVVKSGAHPPWMIVETKRDYGNGHAGLTEYAIRGRTLKGQRWVIFTNSTEDFDSIDVGLVYRCRVRENECWCPDGMIEQMDTIYIPLAYK